MNVALWSSGAAGALYWKKGFIFRAPWEQSFLLLHWPPPGLGPLQCLPENSSSFSLPGLRPQSLAGLWFSPKWKEHWLSVLGPGAFGFPLQSPALEGEPQRRRVCVPETGGQLSLQMSHPVCRCSCCYCCRLFTQGWPGPSWAGPSELLALGPPGTTSRTRLPNHCLPGLNCPPLCFLTVQSPQPNSCHLWDSLFVVGFGCFLIPVSLS